MDNSDFWKVVEQYYGLKKQYNEEGERGTISKCINCSRHVGTIFSQNDRLLKAVCGDKKNPCNLNIQVSMPSISVLSKDMRTENKRIEFLKNKIIEIKNDYIFGYTTEEETVEIFKKLKDELNATVVKSQKLFQIMVEIKPSMEEISKLKIDRDDLIMKYKLLINDYKTSRSTVVLDNAMVLCKEITELGNNIMKMSYPHNSVEKDESNFTLVQNIPLENIEMIDTTLVQNSDMKIYILNDKTRNIHASVFDMFEDSDESQLEELSIGEIDVIPESLEN